jgi:hypothetical protein
MQYLFPGPSGSDQVARTNTLNQLSYKGILHYSFIQNFGRDENNTQVNKIRIINYTTKKIGTLWKVKITKYLPSSPFLPYLLFVSLLYTSFKAIFGFYKSIR